MTVLTTLEIGSTITKANAFRMEMADKGIAGNRIEPLVYRINEVAYALYMGIDFRDTVGCLAKQVNKPLS